MTPRQAFLSSLRRSASVDVWLLPLLVASSFVVPQPLRLVALGIAAFCILVTVAEAVAARAAVLRRQGFEESL